MNLKIKDYTGKVFDNLTVVSFKEQRNQCTFWNCICSCGKEVTKGRDYFVRKFYKSCGCVDRNGNPFDYNKNYRCYTVYHSMLGRCSCTDENSKQFKNYSSRGIDVCDRWKQSFRAFLEDMGDCKEGESIERIDNSKGYSPDNCKWENKSIQEFNKNKLKGCSSKFKGVSFINKDNIYRAYFKQGGKQEHIGRFKSQEDAALARDFYIIQNKPELCAELGYTRLVNYLNFPEKFEEELCLY